MNTLITGDDTQVPMTLLKNGETFAINPAAIIKARLVSTNHVYPLTDDIEQSFSDPGGDWSKSLVMIQLPGSATVHVGQQGPALLEVQVDDNGKVTWFTDINIVLGQIP
jgi:hypothetical protein